MRRLLLAFALVWNAPAIAAAPGVYPAGPEVPANLLRISLAFASPPSGPVLQRVALRHAGGAPISQPFLEQELWSPDGKVLTILLHPGRVKRGLAAAAALGPVIRTDEDIELTLDGQAVKRWHVGPADTEGPMVAAWRIAWSSGALDVTLDQEIDRLGTHFIAVAGPQGRRIKGTARLADDGRHWRFVPATPWRKGDYLLVVHSQLEDPSGNRIGSRFELPSGSAARDSRDAVLPFQARP